MEGGDLSLPYVIKTKAGRSYTIDHHSEVFFPKNYPNTLILSLRERGILLLGLDSIEAIHHEHEAVARR
jgi:hypothetical protein